MKQNIINIVKTRLAIITGIVLGMLAGFLYYYFVGCAGGSCIISSNPFVSTIYGGILGWFVGSAASGGCCMCSGSSCKSKKHSDY